MELIHKYFFLLMSMNKNINFLKRYPYFRNNKEGILNLHTSIFLIIKITFNKSNLQFSCWTESVWNNYLFSFISTVYPHTKLANRYFHWSSKCLQLDKTLSSRSYRKIACLDFQSTFPKYLWSMSTTRLHHQKMKTIPNMQQYVGNFSTTFQQKTNKEQIKTKIKTTQAEQSNK